MRRRSSKSGNTDGPEERVAPEKRNRTTPNAEKEGEEYQAKDPGQHGSKKVSRLLISNGKSTYFSSVILTTIVRSQRRLTCGSQFLCTPLSGTSNLELRSITQPEHGNQPLQGGLETETCRVLPEHRTVPSRRQGCESEGPNSPITVGWTAPAVNPRPFPGK